MKPAVLRPQALRDPQSEARYYRKEAGTRTAVNLVKATEAALDQIELDPGIGSPVLGKLLGIPGLQPHEFHSPHSCCIATVEFKDNRAPHSTSCSRDPRQKDSSTLDGFPPFLTASLRSALISPWGCEPLPKAPPEPVEPSSGRLRRSDRRRDRTEAFLKTVGELGGTLSRPALEQAIDDPFELSLPLYVEQTEQLGP